MSRKDWKPSTNSVLCSTHFEKEAYKVPPTIPGRRAMLQPNAAPTVFPEHPAYLQPPQPKKRRVLNRDIANTSASSSDASEQLENTETLDSVPDVAVQADLPDTPRSCL